MNTPNPIQRFLGLVRATDSPFELLGVTPTACDVQTIHAALARRLDRLANHPEAMSHEAGEVRLALHAAAAQLLDPMVREKLAALESSHNGSPRADPSSHVGFQELAKRVLARSGGWGKESQRWLALLAHAHGLNQMQLQAELRSIVKGAQTPTVLASPAPVPTQPVDRVSPAPIRPTVYEEIHGPRRSERPVLSTPAVWLIGAVMVLTVFAAAMTLRGALGHPSHSVEPSPPKEAAPETSDGGVSSLAPEKNTPLTGGVPQAGEIAESQSPDVVIRWLEIAQQELDENPGEAAWRFERAVASLGASWPAFSTVNRTRANDIVVSLLQRFAPASEHGQRALRAVVAPATTTLTMNAPATGVSVRAAAWSIAMASTLAANPDTVSPVRSAANAMLSQVGVMATGPRGSFEDDMLDGMPIIAQYLTAQTERRSASVMEAWIAWVDIIDRIASESNGSMAFEKKDRLMLDAADRLLRSQAHPGSLPVARDAFELLLSRVSWSASTPTPAAWGAMLSWFDEPGIGTADLAVATEWLVRQQITPRMNPDMTLSRSASLDGRSAVRDRYAQLWGMDAAADSLGFATVWAAAARQVLNRYQKRSPTDRLARAAVMSRLNEAAALQWRGNSIAARAIIMGPTAPIEAAIRPTVRTRGQVREVDVGSDGQWSVRYLSASRQDVQTRSKLLLELGRHAGPLGPVDADVVVQAALRGASSELRARAGQVVKRRAAEAGVISAVLDGVTQAPRNRLTTALIVEITGRRLPSPKDSTWGAEVRLALVDRLLELLGATDEASPIDRLSMALSRSYASRASENAATSGAEAFGNEQYVSDMALARAPTTEPVIQVWMKWRSQAQQRSTSRRAPLSLTQILRHHNGRLQLAQGPMQRFAATQVSIAEAMALVVSAERPSRASEIQRVIETMAAERRTASTILDQMVTAERAMLQLWAIRLGLELREVTPRAVSFDPANVGGEQS